MSCMFNTVPVHQREKDIKASEYDIDSRTRGQSLEEPFERISVERNCTLAPLLVRLASFFLGASWPLGCDFLLTLCDQSSTSVALIWWRFDNVI